MILLPCCSYRLPFNTSPSHFLIIPFWCLSQLPRRITLSYAPWMCTSVARYTYSLISRLLTKENPKTTSVTLFTQLGGLLSFCNTLCSQVRNAKHFPSEFWNTKVTHGEIRYWNMTAPTDRLLCGRLVGSLRSSTLGVRSVRGAYRIARDHSHLSAPIGYE